MFMESVVNFGWLAQFEKQEASEFLNVGRCVQERDESTVEKKIPSSFSNLKFQFSFTKFLAFFFLTPCSTRTIH